MLNRRTFLSCCAGGLIGILGIVNSEASLNNPFKNPIPSLQREYKDLIRQRQELESVRQKIGINYEEWKSAIQNPDSQEAKKVRKKAKFLRDCPEIAISLLKEEEKQEYELFWRNFIIDIKKIKRDFKNPEYEDAVLKYVIPSIVEMQMDIDRTYSPVKIPEDARNSFDYSNLNHGEKLLIFWHFKYNGKYYAEGGKRNIDLFK